MAETRPKLTEARRRALEIVRDHPGISASNFAARMWPDSEGWQHRRKCGGYGVHNGGGMYVAAGQYLGKLRKIGLVRRDYAKQPPETFLTPSGRSALQERPDG